MTNGSLSENSSLASDLDQFHDVLMTDDNGSVAKELHALLMRRTRNKSATFKITRFTIPSLLHK